MPIQLLWLEVVAMRLGLLKHGVAGTMAVALVVTASRSGWGQVQVAPAAFAGVDATGHATTVEAALRSLLSQAAVAFVGTVTGIRRVEGDGFTSAGVVEVSFAVETGLRGAGNGGTYTLREWGGLWAAGETRYRVGSRLLMLLHAPGATGLSSPVGGMDGAIPVKGTSLLIGAGDRTVVTNAPAVDLRWLAAKLVQPTVYSTRSTQMSGGTKEQAKAVRAGVASGARTATDGAAAGETKTAMSADDEMAGLREATVPAAQASVATVVQMLAGWSTDGSNDVSKESNDAR